jgi:ribulose-phosphate 3-epimerase
LPKLEQTGDLVRRRKLPIVIEVDGGIKVDNIDRVVRAGGQVIVSGSGIFKTANYAATIAAMRKAAGVL